VRPIVGVVALVAGAVTGAERPLPANPRELPSLVQRWSWRGEAEAAVLAEGALYVRGKGRVTALEAATGAVLWDTPCVEGEDLFGQGPVVAGNTVAVSFGGTLVLLDRRTGRVRKTVVLGIVHTITAPPLLAVASGRKDRVDLVRVDAESGEVLARQEVGGIVYDVRLAGGVAVAIVGHVTPDTSDSDDEMLAAYRTDGLGEVWRREFRGWPNLEEIADGLYAATLTGEGADAQQEYRRVDPATGELGPPLPARAESKVSGGLTWELEVIALKEGKAPARLRRNSLETGRPVWTAALPGDPRAWVRVDDTLYLHCDHEGGRGYFIVLDWATGARSRAAYGLRDVRALFSKDDSLIAWMEQGVTAFAATAFGRPEGQGRGVRREVEKILDAVTAQDFSMQAQIQAAVTDLKALAPAALPFVAERIPALGPAALVAAARVVADARYRDAAHRLSARLSDPPPRATREGEHWDPAEEVLKALAQIGGQGEVGAIAAVLGDATRDGSTRLQAFTALASIGTADALEAVDKLLGQKPAAERWWQPASPAGFVELIGRPDLKALSDSVREAGDFDQMMKIDAAEASARVSLPAGGALVVFHDARLGGHKDLWVAAADAANRIVTPGRFVGGGPEGPLRASLEGQILVIEGDTPSARPLRVDLSDLAADGDGDGLPDLVEQRLRTDPERQDSDGDGLIDSEDPAPNGAGVPRSEEEEIVHAIFRQFFTFEGTADVAEPAILVGDSPLQWVGRRGPTITLTAAQNDAFVEEAGLDGIGHVFIEPGGQPTGRDEGAVEEPPLASDERHYKLTIHRGGLDAVGYDVIVRKLRGRWLIKECRLAWVS
jgi:outer membrane protein assembly factor BamB